MLKYLLMKCCVGLIASSLIFGVGAKTTHAASMSDVKGHWAEKSIESMFERGVVTGFPDGTFRPNDHVTIEQFATMMLRSLWEKGNDGKLVWAGDYLARIHPMARYYLQENDFDLNNIPQTKNWSEPYFEQFKSMGYFYHYDDPFEGKLDRPLTREVASYMLRMFLEETDYAENRNYAELALQGIKDASNVESTLKYDVELTLLKGMMRGYPDGTFRPKGHITRAEAALIIARMLDRDARDPYKPDLSKSYYTSYETDRGTKYVVFNNKQMNDIWSAAVKASSKSQGYVYRAGGVTYNFYKDKATRDTFQHSVESELFNFSIDDPFDLSIGISSSWNDYFIVKNVNSVTSSLHDSVYDDFVANLFESSEFTLKFNLFGEDYKKDKSIKPRDYMIEARSIRIMREGSDGKIIAFISD